MEFEPGKKYKSKKTKSVFAFIGESAFDKSLLIFESCGCSPFHETRSYAEANFEPYREPIECVRWGYFVRDKGDDGILSYFRDRETCDIERKSYIKSGRMCSEIIEIRGFITH